MTNGEKINEIFPNIVKYGNILIDDTGSLQKNILFDDTWWNAEYKEPTTKNDLGVDAISRDEVCRYVAEFVNHEFSTREEEELIDNIITGIEHMPSVTPQEPIEPMVEIDLDYVIKQKYIEREVLDKIKEQLKSHLRGVEIALEVLVENDPLRPKMEGAKDTLEDCLELIDKAETEADNG